MGEISIPFPIFEILVSPEPTARLRISDDIQQTLASIMGYDGEGRRLLRCGKKGTLFVSSAVLQDIVVLTADQISYVWQGGDIETSEILLRAHPDNAGRVYVRCDSVALATNAWMLDAGESIQFSVNNLNRLHVTIAADTEKAILAYTR